eukprot:Plantae.Rhodophyta-Purpureofilum_apyrenoidigerum.ctg3868.p1 GENE.Plantae.Rhodophyta-Purpureofilum_apyrenoidigerum.ctg3868~~Plantae.Rhodophyta-Purpureofilum_apyrenoidigerum.ctg3868.p1  ORF type:complete len:304 (-),score=34.30 Plantae.Rhodophyta-Purpureofilum_apyrenoidigerum.ctg3868:149-1060(-)
MPKVDRKAQIGGAYYVTTSLLLSTVNKVLLGKLPPLFVLLLQGTTTIAIFSVLLLTDNFSATKRPPWKAMTRLSFCYMMNMMASMTAMSKTSLLMFNTLRRTSIIWVLFLEWYILGNKSSAPVAASVGVIVLGALVAGSKDLVFDLQGYIWSMAANLSTSLYIVFIKQAQNTSNYSTLELLWFNSLLSWPVLFGLNVYTKQLFSAYETLNLGDHDAIFYLNLLASAMLGFFINHATFYNTAASSPLTHTVMSQLKDVCLLLIGFFMFDRRVTSRGTLLGALISFGGSLMYALVKYQERVRKSS